MINIKYLTRISFHHYRLNLFYLESFKYIDTNWLTFNGLIKLTILLALSKIFSFIRTLQSKTERFSLKNYYKVPYINVCYCFLFYINIFIYYISTSCQLWFVFLFVYFPIFLELYSIYSKIIHIMLFVQKKQITLTKTCSLRSMHFYRYFG